MKKILRPVPDKISQLFGKNPQIYNKFGMKGHNGIDYASPRGREIKATDNGTVAYSYNNKGGYGEVVKLKHSWGESIYGHMTKRLVKKGAKVKRGQTIGTVGSTGFSTGNHLHFGIRINPINYNNGYYGWVDPLPHIQKGKTVKLIKSISNRVRAKKITNRLTNGAWDKGIKNKTIDSWITSLDGWTKKQEEKIKTLDKQVATLQDKIALHEKKFKDLNRWEKFQLLFNQTK